MDNKCNCIERMKELAKKPLMEKAGITDENLINNIAMGGELYSFDRGKILSAQMLLEYDYIAKSSGRISNRKEKLNIQFSYCPFCGVKY